MKLGWCEVQVLNNKQWQGKVSRAQGAYFEKLIDCSLTQYAKDGKAFVTKTPEPMRVISRLQGGRFVTCFEKKAEPDYKGCLSPDGREVIFDAKFTMSEQISQNRVTKMQAEILEKHRLAGALCYVLLGFAVNGESPRIYRVEWSSWHNMAGLLSRKHIKLSDLELDGVVLEGIEERLGVRYIPVVGGLPMVLDGLV